METNGKTPPPPRLIKRIVICAVVLLVGIVGMLALSALKTPPAEVVSTEKPIYVETRTAALESVQVIISGYGEVRALETVTISPEVSGRITDIHPRLRLGEIIPEGEILFRIDSRDYQASLDEATATTLQWENTIRRLGVQQKIDAQRLKALERNRELAWAEYRRIKSLYDTDKVGTRSGVEAAERAANNASNQADLLDQTVSLYPIRLKEARNSLTAAQARMDIARTRLERCTVAAPFDGRIKAASLEKNQYVSPGYAAVTLANDSVLEIHVPLDSRDARQWLRFVDTPMRDPRQWFTQLMPVTATIRWTEDTTPRAWTGNLHRVVRFDQKTRTVTVAVRISEFEGGRTAGSERLPLVEGMFCSVALPGRMLDGVVRLPRHAVSFENTVYIARDNRLNTVPVEVARIQGDEALVSGGLVPGDQVIVTRLVEPLENALLKITGNTSG